MECSFTQEISQLIDRELSPEDAAATLIHLDTCERCQQAHDDFLRLQRGLRSHYSPYHPFAKQRLLTKAVSPTQPFWKRRIAVPFPLVATTLVAIIVLALWIGFRGPQPTSLHPARIAAADKAGTEDTFDLSRFDHGERATIAIVKKAEISQGQ